jgi:flagellar biosynthesis component FlhA
MEERIWKSYGVIIPDICIRPLADGSAPGRYIIALSGIPLVAGTVSLEERLFTGPVTELERLNIKARETINPINGVAAYWINRDDWAKEEEAGLFLWDSLEYPLRHLEIVITRNLPEVIGHQEFVRTLAARLPEAVEEVCADGSFLTDLVMVMRAFLAEQVTIAPLATILVEFRCLRETGIPLVEIGEKLRSLELVRAVLPANAAYHSYISVNSAYEQMIAECIENRGSQPVLAMEPAVCQDALAAVRQDVSGITTWAAMVVENAAIRPYVRKLVELEFPYLWVLSRAELLPAQAQPEKFIATIEWEAGETQYGSG